MAVYGAAMAYAPSGHIEQRPSGSWRAKVYAGKDPLSGREIRFRKTRKTEVEAQIEAERRQEEREYQAHLEEAEQRLRSELAAAGNLLAYLYGPEPEAEP
jgi:hypothetical protein